MSVKRKIIKGHEFIRYERISYTEQEMQMRSESFKELMQSRRSIREFSPEPVPLEVIRNCIAAAASAPSGANKQPWTFCLVGNKKLKSAIRDLAEAEEKESYQNRMSDRWLKDLEQFATDWNKPFLEIAPYLIVVFKRVYEKEGEEKVNNYYVNESVGIAVGMLLAALHNAGLATLTHTPSPMNFLQEALNRPANERAYLLIPVGYPSSDAWVPDIKKKAETDYLKEYF
jgi:nitroreductase